MSYLKAKGQKLMKGKFPRKKVKIIQRSFRKFEGIFFLLLENFEKLD